jgi:hypothetical protein
VGCLPLTTHPASSLSSSLSLSFASHRIASSLCVVAVPSHMLMPLLQAADQNA